MIASPVNTTRTSSRRGFTLIELMVAIGLMSILGLLLIGSLRTAVRIVGTGTSRGDAVAAAQEVLSRAEADLVQAIGGPGKRLVMGRDPYGRPFMAVVRALPEERQTPGGFRSGSRSDNEGTWNGVSHDGLFRALGGTCEVVYLMDPTLNETVATVEPPPPLPEPGAEATPLPPRAPVTVRPGTSRKLYRGVLAPAGGTPIEARRTDGSDVPGLIEELEWWHVAHNSSAPEAAGMALKSMRGFDSRYHVLADNILYFGAAIWNSESATWLEGPLGTGPKWIWETAPETGGSYRADLPAGWPVWGGEAGDMPRSYDLPRAVMLSVTVGLLPPLDRATRLVTAVAPTDTTITVASTEGYSAAGEGLKYFRINQEWVEFASVVGNTFYDCRRGARGTRAGTHEAGAEVQGGLTLSRIVNLPAGR